jgi:hypothetical protein
MYQALGIGPSSEVRDREGRSYKISEGTPVVALFS